MSNYHHNVCIYQLYSLSLVIHSLRLLSAQVACCSLCQGPILLDDLLHGFSLLHSHHAALVALEGPSQVLLAESGQVLGDLEAQVGRQGPRVVRYDLLHERKNEVGELIASQYLHELPIECRLDRLRNLVHHVSCDTKIELRVGRRQGNTYSQLCRGL